MAEWLEHWTCNRDSLGSSPTLTVSWVCFWPSHIQLLSQACKFLTGLLSASSLTCHACFCAELPEINFVLSVKSHKILISI